MPLAFILIPAAFVLFGFGHYLARMTMPSKGQSQTRRSTNVLERPRFSSLCSIAALSPLGFGWGAFSFGDSRLVHGAKNFAAEPTFNQRQV